MKKILCSILTGVALFCLGSSAIAGSSSFTLLSANMVVLNTTNTFTTNSFPVSSRQLLSTVGPAIQVNIVGTNTLSTNVGNYVFTFTSSVDGTNYANTSVGLQTFSFSVASNGTNNVYFTTNLPVGLYQNRAKVLLSSLGSTNQADSGVATVTVLEANDL